MIYIYTYNTYIITVVLCTQCTRAHHGDITQLDTTTTQHLLHLFMR